MERETRNTDMLSDINEKVEEDEGFVFIGSIVVCGLRGSEMSGNCEYWDRSLSKGTRATRPLSYLPGAWRVLEGCVRVEFGQRGTETTNYHWPRGRNSKEEWRKRQRERDEMESKQVEGRTDARPCGQTEYQFPE